jgi:hypothetical protein
MLTFILTAAHNIVQPQSSRHIDRGETFAVHAHSGRYPLSISGDIRSV